MDLSVTHIDHYMSLIGKLSNNLNRIFSPKIAWIYWLLTLVAATFHFYQHSLFFFFEMCMHRLLSVERWTVRFLWHNFINLNRKKKNLLKIYRRQLNPYLLTFTYNPLCKKRPRQYTFFCISQKINLCAKISLLCIHMRVLE